MRQLLFLGAFCLIGLRPSVGAACTDSSSRAEALRFDREGGFTALLAPDGDVVAFNQERPWLHSTGRASWLAPAPVVDLRPAGRVLTVEAPPRRESTPGCYVPEWRISSGSLSGGPRSTLRWDPRGLEPTSAIYLSPSGHFATLTAARVHDMEGSQAIVFDLRRRRVATSIAASDVAWGEGDVLLVIDENRERIEAHRRTTRGWAGATVYQPSRPDSSLSFVNEAAGEVVAFERGATGRLLVGSPPMMAPTVGPRARRVSPVLRANCPSPGESPRRSRRRRFCCSISRVVGVWRESREATTTRRLPCRLGAIGLLWWRTTRPSTLTNRR